MAVMKLTEEEYESFEETIASSGKGRAFLREHSRRQRIMSVDEVKRVVYQIRDDIEQRAGPTAPNNRLEVLRAELHEMASSIVETKRQIAQLQPQDTGKNRIMAATGELDAIVSATERATSEIIAHAEALLSVAENVRAAGQGPLADKIESASTEILMACSFQDITGQRTNKVVNAMVAIWGDEALQNSMPAFQQDEDEIDHRPDAHLLNGPAAEGEGVDQSDVDAMFAEMAAPEPPAPAPPSPPPPPKAAAKPAAKAKEPPAPSGASMGQDDIDSLFS